MKVTGLLGLLLVILALVSPALSADNADWCSEGQKAFAAGDFDAANLALSSCLYNPPEDSELASLGYAMRGETYFERGDYQAAVGDFELAVDLWPENASAWRNKSMVHYKLVEYLKAITAISRALGIDPYNTESHFVHATILTAMNRPKLAMDAYDLGFSFESKQTVRKLQEALETKGFRVGALDGVYGVRTRDALKACIAVSCVLDMY